MAEIGFLQVIVAAGVGMTLLGKKVRVRGRGRRERG